MKAEIIRRVFNTEELTPFLDNARLITVGLLGVRIEGTFRPDLLAQSWDWKLDETGLRGVKKVEGMNVEVVLRKNL